MAQLQRYHAHAQGWSRVWSQGRERGGTWWSLQAAGTALSVVGVGRLSGRACPVGPLLSLLAWSAHWVSRVARMSALLWLTRDWGQDRTQEHQEAEESTEPLGLASPEQSAGPPLTTHPLRGTQGPSVSFQGFCCQKQQELWPSHPRFPTPAPSSWFICPSCPRVACCGAFELCSYHQRQRCFHIFSLSSWDRSAGLLGQL